MSAVVKTLREFLLGALTDFAESAGFTDLASSGNLAALIVALAHYQEEGHRLLPEVFLCKSIKDITQMLPGSERVEIGMRSAGLPAIEAALKRCAPLARHGWCVYVEKPGNEFRFGLFRGSLNPIAVSMERTLFGDEMNVVPMIRLHRFANGCVELRNQNGQVHRLMLSEKAGLELTQPQDSALQVAAAACRNVPEDLRETVRTCLERILKRALLDSHGALIVVTAAESVPRFLSDGVVLAPKLDILEHVRGRLFNQDADEYRLHGVASLVGGMLNSDGITVFSSKAQLLAYNCFVRVSQGRAALVGGARSRAYAALREKLGGSLLAVFSQSQDGWTKFEESNV